MSILIDKQRKLKDLEKDLIKLKADIVLLTPTIEEDYLVISTCPYYLKINNNILTEIVDNVAFFNEESVINAREVANAIREYEERIAGLEEDLKNCQTLKIVRRIYE